MKIVVVTNIPAPYRNPVYNILSNRDDVDLLVLFCSISEPNRNWQQRKLNFNHKFLNHSSNTFIHFNWNILKELNQFNPTIVIIAGFNPTMLLTWGWALVKRKKIIPFSDANLHSESTLSLWHRLMRKIVYKTSSAFIGASEKTLNLYRNYKVQESKLFKSCLAIDNIKFKTNNIKKKFDILFCGQFNERKNPLFFAKIAIELNKCRSGFQVLLIGTGPLKKQCITELEMNNIQYYDAGFVQPDEIIALYQSAKVFIFPTSLDPWGLVTNEALAAGLPVLVSSVAGVANELVKNGYNGFVFDNFNLNQWIEKIKILLEDDNLYKHMSVNAVKSIEEYTHEAAAIGIYKAAKFAAIQNYK